MINELFMLYDNCFQIRYSHIEMFMTVFLFELLKSFNQHTNKIWSLKLLSCIVRCWHLFEEGAIDEIYHIFNLQITLRIFIVYIICQLNIDFEQNVNDINFINIKCNSILSLKNSKDIKHCSNIVYSGKINIESNLLKCKFCFNLFYYNTSILDFCCMFCMSFGSISNCWSS